MIADVELMETIARLISPFAIWEKPEDPDSSDWWDWSCDSAARMTARDEAWRVIDGLDLELNQKTGVVTGRLPREKGVE